tara:strand:- start:116 stop:589 length:474 start_codon:yes stop_codon:yes gene_type:complete
MNKINQLKDTQNLKKLINFTIDKNLNNIPSEVFKKYYEDKDITIDFEKSVVKKVIEKTIRKYTNDYSSNTYYKLIEYSDGRDCFNDELESEIYSEIRDGLKTHPNIDDEWVESLDDFYIGDGFISTLLYQFRLFYEKWYLENKINESLGELVSEVEL